MATSTTPTREPAVPARRTPAEASRARVVRWFPSWAREFADQYFAGTTCVFVLHGNVHDLTRQEAGGSPDLRRHHRVPGDAALRHLGRRAAARPEPGAPGLPRAATPSDCAGWSPCSSERIGEPKSWPRDPDTILALLDKLIQQHPDGGGPGQADQPGNHPRLRAVPGPLGRAEPDGRRPGHAAGAAAVVGSEPVHQAA